MSCRDALLRSTHPPTGATSCLDTSRRRAIRLRQFLVLSRLGGTPAQRRYPSVDWPGLALGIPGLAPPCHRAIRAGIAGLHLCSKRSVHGSAGRGLTSGFAGWPLRWGQPAHCARCMGVCAGAGLLQVPGWGVIGMAIEGMATVVRRSCVSCRREGFVYEGGREGLRPGEGVADTISTRISGAGCHRAIARRSTPSVTATRTRTGISKWSQGLEGPTRTGTAMSPIRYVRKVTVDCWRCSP